MTNTFFVDHFRGFKKTAIPIKEVNFFVGENSTGKTSIISLISLFSSGNFWFDGDFRTKDYNFSFFGDVYGKGFRSKNAETTVGLLMDGAKDNELQAYGIKLGSVGGKTALKSLKLATATKEIQILINGSEIQSMVTETKFKKASFSDWALEKIVPSKEFQQATTKHNPPPFFISLSLQDEHRNFMSSLNLFDVFSNHTWVAPIRAKPQKTYDSEVIDESAEGAHTPYILSELYSGISKDAKTEPRLIRALNKFGKESGLFDKIGIRKFSKSSNSPFALTISLSKNKLLVTHVGYGVSQVLPILIEILRHRNGHWMTIQQPEVHLHPKAQASLGQLLYEVAKSKNGRFIIETHSDYIINRFRQMMGREFGKDDVSIDAQIIYFERNKIGNLTHPIEIMPNGTYSLDQPKQFRDFFLEEEFNNLNV